MSEFQPQLCSSPGNAGLAPLSRTLGTHTPSPDRKGPSEPRHLPTITYITYVTYNTNSVSAAGSGVTQALGRKASFNCTSSNPAFWKIHFTPQARRLQLAHRWGAVSGRGLPPHTQL